MAKWITVLIVCLTVVTFPLDNREYVKQTEYVMIGSGDTLDKIAWYFYTKHDARNIVWDAYRHEIWELNNNLRKDGRALRPGDIVKVEYYEAK